MLVRFSLSWVLVTSFYSLQDRILATAIRVKMMENASLVLISCLFSVNVPSNVQGTFVKTVMVSNIYDDRSFAYQSLYRCIVNLNVQCFSFSNLYTNSILWVFFTLVLFGNVSFRSRKYINELIY